LFTLVDIGFMPVLRWWRWRLGYSLLLAAVLLLLVALRRSEPEAGGGRAASSSLIKLFLELPDPGEFVLDLPLSSHHGGGDWEEIFDGGAVDGSAGSLSGVVLLRANHAVTMLVTVIFGQKSGPTSTTSMAEAQSIGCWSSTPTGSQVVHPRLSEGSQGPDLVVGDERSSTPRSGLGGDALNSPAACGRVTFGLDCFFYFLVRVVSVNWKDLSSNSRFYRARDVKGLSCNMYLPRGSE
jgi:hypothetical protein